MKLERWSIYPYLPKDHLEISSTIVSMFSFVILQDTKFFINQIIYLISQINSTSFIKIMFIYGIGLDSLVAKPIK